jgi:sugar O-acyltransferase (sialic acid O-acetyltransferase NeuD family)
LARRQIFGLVGTGGFAREVMPYLKQGSGAHTEWDLTFVDIQVSKSHVNGVPVTLEDDFLRASADAKFFNIAIDNARKRRAVADRLTQGCIPRSIIAPTAVILDNNTIGDGAIICSFAMVTSNARIGQFFHANIYAYVAHDCVIGDFVTFAPGVKCNGNVIVQDGAYIGTGAVIKQGRPDKPLVIGEGAVVGMGAVVTKDVAAGEVVVGNPARVFSR